jgi:hypothetical protein
MAMKPEDRYPSARELAAEIEQWLADEPVRAYPELFTRRLWRWMRRHKGPVASGVSACVALVAIVLGTWIAMLEREIARGQQMARVHDVRNLIRGPEFQRRVDQGNTLDALVRARLDQMAVQFGQGPHVKTDTQRLGNDILVQLLALWDEAIRMDTDARGKPGWRSDFYRLQRALCLARLGDHQQAAQEASRVEVAATSEGAWSKSAFDLEKRYTLARVYALCATLTHEHSEISRGYAERAMTHLLGLAEAGAFKGTARAQRLRDDRDLDFLRPRDDFGKLLAQVEAYAKKPSGQ